MNLMRRAVEEAEQILNGYTQTELYEFAFDRLVDEIYENLRKEVGEYYGEGN